MAEHGRKQWGRELHGHAVQGHRSPEYQSWKSMKSRCNNPNHRSYGQYGGRGIRVCERWVSFKSFLADMGPRPSSEHSLERVDNDRGYEPGNCRWATREEQRSNCRDNVLLTFRGESLPVSVWARRVGMTHQGLSDRLERGWPLEKALTEPACRPGGRLDMLDRKRSPEAPIPEAQEAARAAEFDDESRARVHESVSRLIAGQPTLVVLAVSDERSIQ